MDSETNQVINQLRTEIDQLNEQVGNLQHRADAAFIEISAIFLTLTVTAGALDNTTKERGRYLFSKIQETFVDGASSNEDKEKRLEVLSTAESYVSKFLSRIE